MKIRLLMVATTLLALTYANTAPAQYTYGAPDYGYDRGWYGTNNWYDTNNHYDYLYRTPPYRYSIPSLGPFENWHGFYEYNPNEWTEGWDTFNPRPR